MTTAPSKSLLEIPVTKRHLKQMFHALDTARAEIEAGVADGDIDDRVLAEVDEACDLIEKYINDNRD